MMADQTLEAEIRDATLFFKDLENCERHPKVALRKGRLLLDEVRRLRAVLTAIGKYSYSTEESGITWRDVATDQAKMAIAGLEGGDEPHA